MFCFIYIVYRSPKNTPRELLLKSERMSRLSPAAQKLIKSSVKVSSLTDSTLRASYSTPSPFYAKRATPKTPYGRIKTPVGRVKTPGSTAAAAGGEGSSITDDLLQLPNTWVGGFWELVLDDCREIRKEFTLLLRLQMTFIHMHTHLLRDFLFSKILLLQLSRITFGSLRSKHIL